MPSEYTEMPFVLIEPAVCINASKGDMPNMVKRIISSMEKPKYRKANVLIAVVVLLKDFCIVKVLMSWNRKPVRFLFRFGIIVVKNKIIPIPPTQVVNPL